MTESIILRVVSLVFGTLYPAYASYKAVRSKKDKEYLKWLMYWIVFAFFTSFETFTDTLLSWFPFYYDIKVIVLLRLLSSATGGSSVLYWNYVHSVLTNYERRVNEFINQVKEKGIYMVLIELVPKGVINTTSAIMQAMSKGNGALCVSSTTTEMRRQGESDGRRVSVAREVCVYSDDDSNSDSSSEVNIPLQNFIDANYEEDDIEVDPDYNPDDENSESDSE